MTKVRYRFPQESFFRHMSFQTYQQALDAVEMLFDMKMDVAEIVI